MYSRDGGRRIRRDGRKDAVSDYCKSNVDDDLGCSPRFQILFPSVCAQFAGSVPARDQPIVDIILRPSPDAGAGSEESLQRLIVTGEQMERSHLLPLQRLQVPFRTFEEVSSSGSLPLATSFWPFMHCWMLVAKDTPLF